MKSKIFLARDIAQECTLLEALYYIAFNIYPLYLVCYNETDVRRDSEFDRKGEFGIFCEGDSDLVLDNEACLQHGLPSNPHFEFDDDYIPSFSGYWLNQEHALEKKKFENDIDACAELDEEFEKRKKAAIVCEEKLEEWHEALEDKLKTGKPRLLKFLQNQKIKASGKILARTLKNYSADDDISDEENWDLLSESDEIVAVPSQIWDDVKAKIDWDGSRCYSPDNGCYIDILVSTEDLIKHFSKKSGTTLNSIITKTFEYLCSRDRKIPNAIEVWKEIRTKKDNYPEVIVDMPTNRTISWMVTSTGEIRVMSYKRFQNLISSLKKKKLP